MSDDIINKAIFYSAGIFLTLATITIVINYFSVARDMSNNIGIDNAIYNKYSKILEATIKKDVLFGYDVKNLINYFYDNEDVNININTNLNVNLNSQMYNNYIFNINPIDKYKLSITDNNGKLIMNIVN